jgi:hypothetical protein
MSTLDILLTLPATAPLRARVTCEIKVVGASPGEDAVIDLTVIAPDGTRTLSSSIHPSTNPGGEISLAPSLTFSIVGTHVVEALVRTTSGAAATRGALGVL